MTRLNVQKHARARGLWSLYFMFFIDYFQRDKLPLVVLTAHHAQSHLLIFKVKSFFFIIFTKKNVIGPRSPAFYFSSVLFVPHKNWNIDFHGKKRIFIKSCFVRVRLRIYGDCGNGVLKGKTIMYVLQKYIPQKIDVSKFCRKRINTRVINLTETSLIWKSSECWYSKCHHIIMRRKSFFLCFP